MNWAKNLIETAVQPGKPWEFLDESGIPANVRTDRRARDAWITNPATNHNVYSLVEGINSSGRISSPQPPYEGNAPCKLHGLVADYDVALEPADVLKAVERFGLKPNWYEHTLSGNARLIWIFEKPLNLPPSVKQVGKFLEFVMEAGRFDSLLPALDRGAFIDPARRFTNAARWTKLAEGPLPYELIAGWFVEVSPKLQWDSPEFGTTLPIEVAREKLTERYPKFTEWPGEFVVGAQGPSFWVEGSQSPKSCLVRETGLHTFADHAAKPFYSWSDLLGADFVNQYKTQERGRAVEDIWFDGKSYWFHDATLTWRPSNKTDATQYLKVIRRISDRKSRLTGISPLEEAMAHIHQNQQIDGAAPFCYRKNGDVVPIGPNRYLNISRAQVLQPAIECTPWGPEGKFPFISALLDGILDPPEQLPYLLAEFQYAYMSALKNEPMPGHNIFLAGPTNVGKTLLNREVFGMCMGGYVDAGKFLTGQDNFGAEMFNYGWWTVDDGVSISHSRFHKHFSEMLKSMNANQQFRYHAKFQMPSQTVWCGRIFGTLNDDEESKRQLPSFGISNLDKIALFRAAGKAPFTFPSQPEIRATLERERPYFLAWLCHWTWPSDFECDSRYGLAKAYHEPTLLEGAHQSTPSASFREIVEDWRAHWFKANPKSEIWVGTALQLYKELNADPAVQGAMRHYTVVDIGRELAILQAQGWPAMPSSEDGLRVWRINAPVVTQKAVIEEEKIPGQMDVSKFAK